MSDKRLVAPAVARNREAILAVLTPLLLDRARSYQGQEFQLPKSPTQEAQTAPLHVDNQLAKGTQFTISEGLVPQDQAADRGYRQAHSAHTASKAAPVLHILEIASGSGQHICHFAKALPNVQWYPSDPDMAARASIAAWVDHEGLENVAAPQMLDVLLDDWASQAKKAAHNRQIFLHVDEAIQRVSEGAVPQEIISQKGTSQEDTSQGSISSEASSNSQLSEDAGRRVNTELRFDVILCINMVHISPWQASIGLFRGAADIIQPGGYLYLYGPYRRAGYPTAPSNEAFDLSLRQRNQHWGVRQLDDVVELAQSYGWSLHEIVEMPANNLSVVFKAGR